MTADTAKLFDRLTVLNERMFVNEWMNFVTILLVVMEVELVFHLLVAYRTIRSINL